MECIAHVTCQTILGRSGEHLGGVFLGDQQRNTKHLLRRVQAVFPAYCCAEWTCGTSTDMVATQALLGYVTGV
jgi:hypothetical protein